MLGRRHPRERLVEQDLCDRFNTHRGDIRLALFELEKKGLIQRIPNRGAIVRHLTPREVMEIYAVREELEVMAARILPFPVAATDLARIEDLETRAVAAIEASRQELATKAAEAIATLEAERDASSTARTLFAAEITKLKGHVLQQQMRFSQLERGRRIARAAEAVRVARRGRIEGAPIFAGTLAEAEATLARLREHQVEADAAEAAFDAIDAATGPVAVAEKLSSEGFGPRLKPNAADVLARLRERAGCGKPEAAA